MGRTNVASGGSELNVFAQLEEPSKKDGVWIKTENVYDYDVYTQLTDIPYEVWGGSAIAIGTDVYLFGSGSSNYQKYAYKYDTLTDSYTKLTNIPYNFHDGSAVAIGTDIYLFGSNYYGNSSFKYIKYAYKYDTLTDSYTKLTDIPYEFSRGTTIAIDTDVYLFGGTTYINAYKYDTLTDSYTKLTNIPYNFYDGSAAAIGTDVYLFGSIDSSYYRYAYKYDTLTNSYTKLTNIPYDFVEGSAVAIGTDVYLFGSGSSNYQKYAYKYDTLTNTYTQLTSIPYNFYSGSVVAVGIDVYLFGSYNLSYRKYAYKYELKAIAYPEISKYKYDGIEIIGNSIGIDKRTQLQKIEGYAMGSNSLVAINNDIYLFGGTAHNPNQAYKYDTTTNTYTQLTDIPYFFGSGSAVAIGTNVYLFGGSDSKTIAYKYNTLTNKYTKLTNIPYEFYYGRVVAIGTNVYLFGGFDSSYSKYTYKYDTLTNRYTKLTDIPYSFSNGDAVAIGTDVYLFGSSYSSYSKYAYKYNTLTNTYTQLASTPYESNSGHNNIVSLFNRYIFLFSFSRKQYTSSNTYTSIYIFGIYDINLDKYIQLLDLDSFYGAPLIVNNILYTFNNDNEQNSIIYKSNIKGFKNNYINILNGDFDILLTKTLQTYISNAYIFKDDKIQEYPCYYGDGTKWNLIE